VGCDVVIRPATLDDARAVARVHVRSWRGAYTGLLPGDLLRAISVDQRERRWRQTIGGGGRSGLLLVVVVAELLGGFAYLCQAEDGGARPQVGQLDALYLDPSCWGRGLGRQLHDRALEALGALGYRSAVLWVLEGNVRARGFYERMGWTADGAVKVERWEGFTLHEVRYLRELSSGS
jgi:GNAT superfamily N-acetyltransferase